MNIGYELRKARWEKGLYMWQVGNMINLSESCVCRYEVGRQKIPADLLVKWAHVVGATDLLRSQCYNCPIYRAMHPEVA